MSDSESKIIRVEEDGDKRVVVRLSSDGKEIREIKFVCEPGSMKSILTKLGK